jgi:hypothetical protein
MNSAQVPPLPSSRTGLPRLLFAFLVGVVIALAAAAFSFFAPIVSYVLSPAPDFPMLEAEGDTLRAAVERYHSEHGSYPPTLEAAGVASPKTRWGYWEYSLRGATYVLRVGNYDKHGFVLFREGVHSAWHRDT